MAGELLLKKETADVDSLEGRDIKLALDRAGELIIFNFLKGSGIPILSEESGFQNGTGENLKKGRLWIIDPLDGSFNYWKKIRELSCVSIALWENGKPVLGVINRFTCSELFSGVVGTGAWLNDRQITVSKTIKLSEAALAAGFPLKRSYDDKSLGTFVKQIQNFKKVRMFGTAAIMGVFVACGRLDAYIEEYIMLWDIAASSAIVTAAGGCVELEMQDEFKCICRLFSNKKLMDEFYEKCV